VRFTKRQMELIPEKRFTILRNNNAAFLHHTIRQTLYKVYKVSICVYNITADVTTLIGKQALNSKCIIRKMLVLRSYCLLIRP